MSNQHGANRCQRHQPLTAVARFLVLSGAIGLAVLLGIARWLEPAERGFGTHQGLGLPQCSIIEWFGVRCPSCGMTTAWAHWVRGSFRRAFAANAGGSLLAMIAVFAVPWLSISGMIGRWWFVTPKDWAVIVVVGIFFTVTLTDWLLRVGW